MFVGVSDLSEAPEGKVREKVAWNLLTSQVGRGGTSSPHRPSQSEYAKCGSLYGRPPRPNSCPSSVLEISIPLCNVRAIIPSEIPAYKTEFAEFGGLIDFGTVTSGPSKILSCSSSHFVDKSSAVFTWENFNLGFRSIASQLPFPCLQMPIHKLSS